MLKTSDLQRSERPYPKKLIPENGELGIFLEGDLSALLFFASNRKSALRHLDAGVLEKFLVQGSMVAGAGFEPAAFRL